MWSDIAAPYHQFAAPFFENAADPESPVPPFSEESAAPREAAIGVYREVPAAAKGGAEPEPAQPLPRLP